ncbi:MAG: DM13 domain-containing protein, partial [Candidatus Thorarchaeota archaeon]
MKKVIIGVISIVVIIIIIFGLWYYLSSKAIEKEIDEKSPLDMNDDMPSNATIIAEGQFSGTNYDVKGKALLIKNNDKYIIRLEDFESESGPGLYVYLSTSLDDNDFIDLGKLKATKGNINYDVSSNTDFDKYDNVLIWCEPFGVLFGSA